MHVLDILFLLSINQSIDESINNVHRMATHCTVKNVDKKYLILMIFVELSGRLRRGTKWPTMLGSTSCGGQGPHLISPYHGEQCTAWATLSVGTVIIVKFTTYQCASLCTGASLGDFYFIWYIIIIIRLICCIQNSNEIPARFNIQLTLVSTDNWWC